MVSHHQVATALRQDEIGKARHDPADTTHPLTISAATPMLAAEGNAVDAAVTARAILCLLCLARALPRRTPAITVFPPSRLRSASRLRDETPPIFQGLLLLMAPAAEEKLRPRSAEDRDDARIELTESTSDVPRSGARRRWPPLQTLNLDMNAARRRGSSCEEGAPVPRFRRMDHPGNVTFSSHHST